MDLTHTDSAAASIRIFGDLTGDMLPSCGDIQVTRVCLNNSHTWLCHDKIFRKMLNAFPAALLAVCRTVAAILCSCSHTYCLGGPQYSLWSFSRLVARALNCRILGHVFARLMGPWPPCPYGVSSRRTYLTPGTFLVDSKPRKNSSCPTSVRYANRGSPLGRIIQDY